MKHQRRRRRHRKLYTDHTSYSRIYISKTFSSSKKKATSEVDDQFFNLKEFNKWTDKQEELDMMSDRDDQDDGFDFDNDMGEEEDSDEEEEEDDAYEATGKKENISLMRVIYIEIVYFYRNDIQ
jgi:hypothetical protein